MRTLFSAGAILALLLLAACQQAAPAPDEPIEEEEPSVVTISVEEGAQVLEDQLGSVDAATGNPMSYAYEGTVTLEGASYYNYRVSWLVGGDHLSYLTNYLVSTDGRVVQEYLLEAPAL
jgi:hypothetical protein